MIIFILACTKDGGIGYQNSLPWKIKNEMLIFKKLTLKYQLLLMGRKTFDSLKVPLKERKNLVLTSKKNDLNFENLFFLKFSKNAEKITKNINFKSNNQFDFDNFVNFYHKTNNNIAIIGGEQIFDLFFDYCDEIYISIINKNYQCDRYFNFLDKVFDDNYFKEIKKDRIYDDEFINYHFIKKYN